MIYSVAVEVLGEGNRGLLPSIRRVVICPQQFELVKLASKQRR